MGAALTRTFKKSKPTIGKGSEATVHKLRFGRQTVAVKQPMEDAVFKHERSVLQRLAHLNIVSYLGDMQLKGKNSILLEYAHNGDLQNWLQKKQRTENDLKPILRGVLQGLSYLHQNVVHGDLKEANILITSKEIAKLADFSGCFEEGQRERVVFTPGYAPPDDLLESIWSFGAMLVAIMNNDVPLASASSEQEIQSKLLRGESPRVLHPEQISESLLVLISKCLQQEAKHRPTAEELLKSEWFNTNTSNPLPHGKRMVNQRK